MVTSVSQLEVARLSHINDCSDGRLEQIQNPCIRHDHRRAKRPASPRIRSSQSDAVTLPTWSRFTMSDG
jgi:hypothetical protein